MLHSIIGFVFGLSLLVGCAAGENQPPAPKTIASVGAGAVVLLGDSRTSQDTVSTLCGRPVFNAGISGVTLDMLRRSIDWTGLRQYPPALIILAVGINNTHTGQETPGAEFMAGWTALVADLLALGVPVLPSTMAEPELYEKGLWVNLPLLQWENEQIRLEAAQRQGLLFDVMPLIEEVHAQQQLYTTDGIHYTSEFYAALHQAYKAQCS